MSEARERGRGVRGAVFDACADLALEAHVTMVTEGVGGDVGVSAREESIRGVHPVAKLAEPLLNVLPVHRHTLRLEFLRQLVHSAG